MNHYDKMMTRLDPNYKKGKQIPYKPVWKKPVKVVVKV